MYEEIIKQLATTNTKLVAVSKTKPAEEILKLYHKGHRVFGENKAQELSEKYEALPKDIEWHFIGHLQRNKVKYLAPFIAMLHGVDSLRLLKEVNKQAKKHDRVIACLLQFHIAEEETKYGLDLAEAKAILESEAYQNMENVQICGVMGMATFTDDEQQIKREFDQLRGIFETLKAEFFADNPDFKEISMGMSGDYLIAQQAGSTMVRIGTLLFGERNYD
jgi:pyridoxal phosphate enzyme (YggS family)